jgi:predicted ATP-dependent Lon-type protease
MIDTAFFDRFHSYVPGWEVPKMRPEFFTNQYGMIVDYLAEFMREMRKRTFADAINKFFKLGRDLNQRDTIAVKLPRRPTCWRSTRQSRPRAPVTPAKALRWSPRR